ncbi:phage major capsid protein [Sphingobium olei]|uniref:Phage major capsid protein n=1 Tax=Sphingobium olei TaxID=420955 RepID=A0ABW3NTH0_9SPHN|nr:phage major capsid protein [Sphingobium sp.]
MKMTSLAGAVARTVVASARPSAIPANPLPTPRAVIVLPRADNENPMTLIQQIQAAVTELRRKQDEADEGRTTQAEVDALITPINAEIDRLSAALSAAQLGGGASDGLSADERQHSTAFATWFRRGDVDADLGQLSVNAALTTQSDPDGGYLVPVDWEQGIDRVLGTMSVMRQLARVISVGSGGYRKLVNVGGATSGWTGEEDARASTSTPTLRELSIPFGEIYAEPAVTQTLLDDARFDVAGWLADELAIEFSEEEGASFISGNGKNKPRGILAYDTVANANYAWGKVGFVKTGAAAAFASTNPADALIDLLFALRQGYRNGAAFLTSDSVMAEIRKWKDGQGNYLWAAPTAADQVGTILGKPAYTDDYMDGLAAGKFPVAVADWKKAYTIADRRGTQLLRDPYTNKPFVKFYTTKRVGGGITNFEAIKLLKCSA